MMGDANEEANRELMRQAALARRRAIDPLERAYRSDELCQQLLESLDLTLALSGWDRDAAAAMPAAPVAAMPVAPVAADPPAVAVYAAFPDELDLATFIQGAYDRGLRVAFPVMMKDARSENDVRQTMEMRQVPFEAWRAGDVDFLAHPLRTYAHGDPRLDACPFVPASQLAMQVVPLVAFDGHGNRLGYGGGNYDRYLTQLPASARVVGVAFSEQQVDAVPVEEHDVPLPILSI